MAVAARRCGGEWPAGEKALPARVSTEQDVTSGSLQYSRARGKYMWVVDSAQYSNAAIQSKKTVVRYALQPIPLPCFSASRVKSIITIQVFASFRLRHHDIKSMHAGVMNSCSFIFQSWSPACGLSTRVCACLLKMDTALIPPEISQSLLPTSSNIIFINMNGGPLGVRNSLV